MIINKVKAIEFSPADTDDHGIIRSFGKTPFGGEYMIYADGKDFGGYRVYLDGAFVAAMQSPLGAIDAANQHFFVKVRQFADEWILG